LAVAAKLLSPAGIAAGMAAAAAAAAL